MKFRECHFAIDDPVLPQTCGRCPGKSSTFLPFRLARCLEGWESGSMMVLQRLVDDASMMLILPAHLKPMARTCCLAPHRRQNKVDNLLFRFLPAAGRLWLRLSCFILLLVLVLPIGPLESTENRVSSSLQESRYMIQSSVANNWVH